MMPRLLRCVLPVFLLLQVASGSPYIATRSLNRRSSHPTAAPTTSRAYAFPPGGVCTVAASNRHRSTFDCDGVPARSGGQRTGTQRLCNCQHHRGATNCTIEPHETTIVSAADQSCTNACAAFGKICTVAALVCMNEYVDSEAEMGALMATLGHNCQTFNLERGNASDVPNIETEMKWRDPDVTVIIPPGDGDGESGPDFRMLMLPASAVGLVWVMFVRGKRPKPMMSPAPEITPAASEAAFQLDLSAVDSPSYFRPSRRQSKDVESLVLEPFTP
eukprot:TRINITY_DN10500_c0_g1_i1.p1 TRINITY_DN10500_c0_g1~~TRINITY_DN10500_c0_g1_i1.p1  ORF type:complete len:275 (+),score=25.63 TRINITY_DN10500_c0_g1_i1:254-1078(+)